MVNSKVWFITGASSGFGRTMAEYVMSKGDKVVATLRKPNVLDDLKAKYHSATLLIVKLDVTNPKEISDAFKKAKDVFGRIDVVFNNAGRNLVAEVEGTPDDQAHALFNANFWGASNVSVEAIKFFREVNGAEVGGRLLINASISAFLPAPTMGFYSASKSALERVTESMAKELDPDWNIKITLIEAGRFATEVAANSAVVPVHPAYSNPYLLGNLIRAFFKDPHEIPAVDTLEGIKIIYKLTELEQPPMHFPLGHDALSALKARNRDSSAEVKEYGPWSDVLPKL